MMPPGTTDLSEGSPTFEVKTEQQLLDFYHKLGVARNKLPAEHTEKGQQVTRAFNHAQKVAVCQFAYRGPQTGVLYVHYALKRETVHAQLADE